MRPLFSFPLVLLLTSTGLFGQAQTIWQPPPQVDWQWQLTGPVDQSVAATVFDIDLFDNDASIVASLHAKGRKVICYVSVGTFEDWRPDAARFPEAVKGLPLADFPNERWLDIRRLDDLKPILEARFDLCKQKGFDAIEPDNVDAYTNRSGFPLTARDQIQFNTWLASAAHARGLSVGLKNDLDQVRELEPLFDWALSEQCFQYKECALLKPFLDRGKAVLEVEYKMDPSKFCTDANLLNINAMRKNLSLDAPRTPCRTVAAVAPRIAGITNAASFESKPISPGLLVAVFGSNLKRVLFDGVEAPIVYMSPQQAVFAVPYAVAGKATVTVQAENDGVRSEGFSMAVAPAAPALFTASSTGVGQVAMLNQSGELNGSSAPATRGSIVTCFATGEGQTTPGGVDGKINSGVLPSPLLPVSVQVGGVNAEVLYAGAAPGMIAGVMQLNFRVPGGVAVSNETSVILRVGTFASSGKVTMAVKAE
ncbi:MAG: endo alpha-1,4 polygalactosaminidase [Acidobacteria bacterium]|nr:endo alpha-1,4 polygalactosaminidase [Acidobacteriota bacterium]